MHSPPALAHLKFTDTWSLKENELGCIPMGGSQAGRVTLLLCVSQGAGATVAAQVTQGLSWSKHSTALPSLSTQASPEQAGFTLGIAIWFLCHLSFLFSFSLCIALAFDRCLKILVEREKLLFFTFFPLNSFLHLLAFSFYILEVFFHFRKD